MKKNTLKHPPARVAEIAVNLDDVSPQVIGDAIRRLLDAGALDVWTTPIGMKKLRPGVMLSLLCPQSEREKLARLMLELTGAMGVRFREWDRLVLDRGHVTAATRFGEIRVKVGALEGRTIVAQPEFEDVKTAADRAGVPVRVVMQAASAAAEGLLDTPKKVSASRRNRGNS